MLLSTEISKVRSEMLSLEEESTVLRQRLKCAEEDAESEKKCSMEMSLQIDRLKLDLEESRFEKDNSEEIFKSKVAMLKSENNEALDQISNLQTELNTLSKKREELLCQIEEQKVLTSEAEQATKRYTDTETEIRKVNKESRNERTKLRMRLRNTQASLDGFRDRYKEALEKQDFMDDKFKEASVKLKERLATTAVENLNLKKQLASVQAHLTTTPTHATAAS